MDQKEELWELGLGQGFQEKEQRRGMVELALESPTTKSPHLYIASQHASVHNPNLCSAIAKHTFVDMQHWN